MAEERSGRMPGCTHACADDLFLAVCDRLEAGRRRELERHLAGCADCRAREETLRLIHRQVRSWGDELLADHVPSELLVRYAESRSLPAPDQRLQIERHLALCESCEEDLRILREVGGSPAEAPVPLRARVRAWLAPAARPVPAWAAAAVLALLLVPAGLGVRHWLAGPAGPGAGGSTVLPLGIPQVLEAGTERGEGEVPVLRAPSERPVVVEVGVPVLDVPGVRYDARLLDAAGRRLWRAEDLRSSDDFGTFLLLLDAADLPAGSYRLVVSEVRPDGAATDFAFPFRLRRD